MISEKESTFISAKGLFLASLIAIAIISADFAALIPATASSITAQSFGCKLSFLQARRKTSGSGLE